MSRYSDLEITFIKRDERKYAAGFRFNSAEDAAEQRSALEPVIAIDMSAQTGDDAEAYADTLTAAFFTPEVRGEFNRFRAAAAAIGSILRVRLTIDANAPELHAIHWETLRDPNRIDDKSAHLFTGEEIVVSRFLSSGTDWRPIRLKPKAALKALVVVANPASGAKYGLEPIDVTAETELATKAMTGIHVSSWAANEAVTLNALGARLRENFDILYLVCHGKVVDGEPYLYLDDGQPAAGAELVQAIRELENRPRMVVLASCQSAGSGGVGLAALGPKLAEAGVPAVIAMQGNVFMATAAEFMQTFFEELLQDGQIDRAMAVARGNVRRSTDYWMPVLFLRLRDGCIWYEPGFGGEGKAEFDKWKAICSSVRSGRFIPILGPELGEDIFGGTSELAGNLADKHAFPLSPHERTDLAKVAQVICVEQKRSYACDAIQNEFLAQIRRRLDETRFDASQASMPALLDAAVNQCRSNCEHPYRVLSELPASIYVNASYEPMLVRVLKAEGKNAEPVFTSWRGEDVPQKPQPQNPKPTPESPWVYHVFGIFGKPNSMVLTEDDFFDYLIATSRLDLLLPTLVGQLMQSSLLFLGFRLEDWRFRVLLRMIVTRPGTRTLRDLAHVGVQVNPGEQSVADVNKARKYIESYFQGGDDSPEISIYWGSPTDFLNQLRENLKSDLGQDAAPVAAGGGDEWY
ncbi:MAG TPA: CHAT domain-containing protein [Terracidiphilus sp.]|nr:CHAT domain-containing protein [Terracidiphilus sp.]